MKLHRAFNVAQGTGPLAVSWQRGKRVAYTRAAAVHAGEARWDETLTLVVPLHTDTRTSKVREATAVGAGCCRRAIPASQLAQLPAGKSSQRASPRTTRSRLAEVLRHG